jgi:DHA3 family macrolide efflux protein-like MFS transporter
VAIFLIFGIDNYGILLICAFARSLGQGVQTPAVGAFIPQIVPEEHLTKINGFQSSIQSFVNLTSPMISGALMTFAPLHILFFLDVVTAAIGICIVFFFVKVPKTESQILEQKKADYFLELKDGLKYIKKYGYLYRIIIITAICTFLITPASFLTPLQVTRNFGADVWRLSVMEIIFSVGMMAGGILIGIWGGFKNRIYTMALCCVLCGLLSAGLGLAPSFVPYLVIIVLIGLVLPMYNAPAMVLLQTNVEPAFMGRVLSFFAMVNGIMPPFGMVLFGPLADIVSIDTLLVITGLLMSLLCIPLIASKTLKDIGINHGK